jgi:biotin operon repressor
MSEPTTPRRRGCHISVDIYREACRLLWLNHSQRSVAKQLGISKGIVSKFAKGLR